MYTGRARILYNSQIIKIMASGNKNVGSSGIRRIVPIVGIDFIAGNLATKSDLVKRGTTYPYGSRPASIGGRTRRWSQVNFMQVNPANFRVDAPNASQTAARTNFTIAVKSALATIGNLAVVTRIQEDFYINNVVRAGVDPKQYATLRGWIAAVRQAQIKAGDQITEETNTWFS